MASATRTASRSFATAARGGSAPAICFQAKTCFWSLVTSWKFAADVLIWYGDMLTGPRFSLARIARNPFTSVDYSAFPRLPQATGVRCLQQGSRVSFGDEN